MHPRFNRSALGHKCHTMLRLYWKDMQMTSQPSAQKNPINSSRKSISGCEAHPINRPLIRVAVGPRVDLSCCRCPVVEARPAGWRDRPRARTLAGGAIRLDAAMMAGVSLLALLAAGGSLACSEIPGYRGSPSEDVALEAWTLQPTPNGGGGTCRCCGLCPQRADCSALPTAPTRTAASADSVTSGPTAAHSPTAPTHTAACSSAG